MTPPTAPRIAAITSSLAERARSEGWDYEHYLVQVLSEEVASRESHGGDARVRAARFPQVKTLDDFDFSFCRSVKRAQMSAPGEPCRLVSWVESNSSQNHAHTCGEFSRAGHRTRRSLWTVHTGSGCQKARSIS